MSRTNLNTILRHSRYTWQRQWNRNLARLNARERYRRNAGRVVITQQNAFMVHPQSSTLSGGRRLAASARSLRPNFTNSLSGLRVTASY